MNEIEKRREALGLSREQLATIAGVSRMTVYNYERSYDNATVGKLDKIARALGCNLIDLFDLKSH